MESSLIRELREAKEEIEVLISRMERLEAFNGEFVAELTNMNLTDDQKIKLEKMILG